MVGLNVVFTGPAQDEAGNSVLRDDLKKLALEKGYVIQGSVQRTTQILVASRTDTVKARAALAKGLLVVTYPQFIRSLGGVVAKDGRRNVWVDGPEVRVTTKHVPEMDGKFEVL